MVHVDLLVSLPFLTLFLWENESQIPNNWLTKMQNIINSNYNPVFISTVSDFPLLFSAFLFSQLSSLSLPLQSRTCTPIVFAWTHTLYSLWNKNINKHTGLISSYQVLQFFLNHENYESDILSSHSSPIHILAEALLACAWSVTRASSLVSWFQSLLLSIHPADASSS